MSVVLTTRRHYEEDRTTYQSIGEAAFVAISELDNDLSYPVRVIEEDQVLWEQDGPQGEAIGQLRELANMYALQTLVGKTVSSLELDSKPHKPKSLKAIVFTDSTRLELEASDYGNIVFTEVILGEWYLTKG